MYMEYPQSSGHSERFMPAVFGWMTAALAVTSLTAYYVAATPVIIATIFTSPLAQLMLFIFQIGLVVTLSFYLQRMSFAVAALCFILYAISLGVTLSVILLLYTQASIFSTFLTTAAMFGIMSLYGFFTRSDLTAVGSMSIMLLFGLIVALLINMFFQSQTFDYVVSFIGVIIFTLLTAYDTQRLKQIGRQVQADQETVGKLALFGALTLYLDFINLFLFLLRFTGRQK